MQPATPARTGLRRYLPTIGSPAYHVMLATVAIFILGPLGGISAAYMNFSIGFFVGGQVLAGILGSTVTLPYGPEGRHGGNYMQTMAASVAGMCGMGVLMQAMVWLGLPEPPVWQLVLFYMSIGMFGVGVGMLYTPLLVDRMQLSFPSGFAVANILRALTDKVLLRRSIAKLGGGMVGGYGLALLLTWGSFMQVVLKLLQAVCSRLPFMSAAQSGAAASQTFDLITNFSASTFGAGMIVGARIALPALVVALIGEALKPNLVSIGWLDQGAPFRKIGFIIALGTILGAAIVDLVMILTQAVRRLRQRNAEPSKPPEDWKRVNIFRLVLWVAFWAICIVVIGSRVLHQPASFLIVAVGLCFLFVLVNGISLGISDSNPISSAFVMTVFILASLGLKQPGVGLMCASVLLIACSEGGDMQQDRSTGWRLGTNRIVQFRYQVIGIAMGAVLAVALAKTFMSAYPVLREDQFSSKVEGAEQWQSAMTYKFVGALRGITQSRTLWFEPENFTNATALATELTNPTNTISQSLHDRLSPAALRSLAAPNPGSPQLQSTLAEEFNRLLRGPSLYDPSRFAGISLSAEARYWLQHQPQGDLLVRLNRLLLEDAYPNTIAQSMRSQPQVMTALKLGILIGLLIEIARKLLRNRVSYRRFVERSRTGRITDFVLDSFVLPSPYASSFGGFVELLTTIWWAAGGVFSSVFETLKARRQANQNGDLPADMSTTSLVGGGLIAGDSLAALSIGVYGLLRFLIHPH